MGHQIDYPLLYYYIFWTFLDVVQISEKKRLQCVKNVNRVIMCEASENAVFMGTMPVIARKTFLIGDG